MPAIRAPAVAGLFYPADATALRARVRGFLDDLPATPPTDAPRLPKLIIVPHAGLVYSGPVAAAAYALLASHAGTIRRVVLLGPTHRVPLRGLAVPDVDAFETPLGRIPIDGPGRDALAGLPQVVRDDRPHRLEHSLEVQLPFLQEVLGTDFTLLPLAVGDADADDVAAVLERAWGGDETLIVVSSDLSHYLPAEVARRVDRETSARIVARDSHLSPEDACGAHALNGAMRALRRHGLVPRLLDLRNSGDTAGDPARVVGYGAFACDAPPRPGEDEAAPADSARLGEALLARARNAIASSLGLSVRPEPGHPLLATPGATFVTLRRPDGTLRGCVGRLSPIERLEEDVRHNARAAAFEDRRFEAITADEWPEVTIEVSLLDAPVPVPGAHSLEAAAALVRPHRDGLVLEWRGHRATLLPQVWEQLPAPRDFLAALVRKAGLPAGFWADDLVLARYAVRAFTEPGKPAREAPVAREAP